MPELDAVEGSDFYFVDASEPDDAVRKLLSVVRDRIPSRFGLDPVRDIQVLCPMNRGSLGARALNLELQKVLNPPGETRMERFGWTYGVGDKVMQIANDYERDVFNGDLGIVTAINTEEGELVASFDGRAVRYGFGELDELVLAYATTIHKSLGIGVSGRGHSADDATLHHARAQSALHRSDPGQTSSRAGGTATSAGDCGPKPGWPAKVVETPGADGLVNPCSRGSSCADRSKDNHDRRVLTRPALVSLVSSTWREHGQHGHGAKPGRS